MTKDEALKWMIENNKLESQQSTMTYEQGFVHGYEAHRVEKALEQPTQNPIFWMHEVEEAPFEGHQVTVSPKQDDYYTIPIYAHPAPQLAQDEEDDMAFWERLESEVNENGY